MTGSPAEPEANEDDLKRRFKEALDRKRDEARERHGTSGGGGPKVRGTHGRADGRRQFRRKSG
ncbi:MULTISPECIES: DUF5302 domain-containing protein [Actinomadura]|uniref:DUF5302 domain-containing protein n=1 Tax=Actinomadura miaoliensis TaxID=430685 RepID=A0ABP7WI26_9ACTN